MYIAYIVIGTFSSVDHSDSTPGSDAPTYSGWRPDSRSCNLELGENYIQIDDPPKRMQKFKFILFISSGIEK